MNILLLTSTFPSGRHDSMQHPFQLDVIDMLRKGGHQVTVLTHNRGGPHEKVDEDLDIVWFPWRTAKGRLAEIDFLEGGKVLSLLSLLYNGVTYAKRVIAQKSIDLAICLWVIPSGFYMYINSLLRTTRVPYVLWALGSDINKYRHNALMRFLLGRIICRSAYVFADGFELCDTIRAMSGRHCEFLPTFRKLFATPIEVSSVADGCVSFLYVGRHTKVKGIDVLIQAIDEVEKAAPGLNYCVTIAGEGELTQRLTVMVHERRLDHRVKFEGKVEDDRLRQLYMQADCVVIPSRAESIPLVFSEALQCGKAMIVTDAGDMGVLGRQYAVARVVPKEDASALALAMRDFIIDPLRIEPAKRDALLSLLTMEPSFRKMLNFISAWGSA